MNGNLAVEPTPNQIKALVAQGKGPALEFTTAVPSVLALGQKISAFANAGGGTILVGVQDTPKRIVGCDYTLLSNLYLRAIAKVNPTPNNYLHRVTVDGKDVGVIRVASSPHVIVSAAGAFTREGNRERAMVAEEIAAKLGPPPAVEAPANAQPANEQPANVQPANEQAELAVAIANLTETVNQLRQDVANAQKLRAQAKGLAVGFVLGILASFIASYLFKWADTPAPK